MSDNTRHLILSDDVKASTVKDLIKSIIDINAMDEEQDKQVKDYKRTPIKLIINSFGGSIYDGLGLVSAIETSKTPVHTICLGSAMSMGFIIFLSGHKRFAHKYSTFMYHELACRFDSKLEGIKQQTTELQRLQDLLDNLTLDKTKLTKEKIEDIKSNKKDWYISAKEAVKLGIVDELL